MQYLNHSEGIERLIDLLLQEKLIPIWGAGFTKDCDTKFNKVPDGNYSIKLMKELISEVGVDITDLNDFDTTSRRFFRTVELEKKDRFFGKYFTNVRLKDFQREFLELPWKYGYTLNIDDGIESNSDFQPVLPYLYAKSPSSSIRTLYKLHGDAHYELKYMHPEDENIVFISEQYVDSLISEKNTTMRNSLVSDYMQKNLIFIGCSLKKELDLLYLCKKWKDQIPPNLIRAVIKTQQPSENEEFDLEYHGINTVILITDYEQFYRDFMKVCNKKIGETRVDDFPFLNSSIEKLSHCDQALDIFTGFDPFVETKNQFLWSDLIVQRAVISEIEDEIDKQNFMLIKGRRFSGRTSLLMMLMPRLNKYSIYYFPSTTLEDEEVISLLIKNKKNSLFLFDSNSLTNSTYLSVSNSSLFLEENGNKVIIVVNSNDTYMIEKTNAKIYDLSHWFNLDERKKLNDIADAYGLLRRKERNTNIDYLKRLEDEQKIKIPALESLPNVLSANEQVLVILLCIKEKVFFSDAFALNICVKEIENLCNRMNNIIEVVPVSRGEAYTHSTQKLVHNSKYVLQAQVAQMKQEDITNTIKHIVKSFKDDKNRKRIAIDVILFDNLNQAFGGQTGAGKLIYHLYEDLEELLKSDLNYWLQRAKSIYRIYPNHWKKLQTAYKYAKKVYSDSQENNDTRMMAKAALTLSLICCLLSEKAYSSSEQDEYKTEAIDYAHYAMTSEFYTKYDTNIFNEYTDNGRKKYDIMISDVCKDATTKHPSSEIRKKSGKILQYFAKP